MITDQLAQVLQTAMESARTHGDLPAGTDTAIPIRLETPPDKRFGDYSTNIALALKRSTGISDGRVIASVLCKHIPAQHDLLEKVEVAGPGFINLFLKPFWLHNALFTIEQEGVCYGRTSARKGERILLEFVSANPTGPISVVNGRAAALGDVLANLLAAQGCEVQREFYVNDALNSSQIEKFALTVQARYLQLMGHPLIMPDGRLEPGAPAAHECEPVEFPQNGYPGEYVTDIARAILQETKGRYYQILLQQAAGEEPQNPQDKQEQEAFFRSATLQHMVLAQRNALEAFGVTYQTWFYESSLYENGEVEKTIACLTDRGYTYPQEDALWLRSTEFGDSKDRVLVRSNEKATYIAADAAYHANKFERGFTSLIDILGADHHGYVARLKASVAALGLPVEQLNVILTQMVSLMRDGEAVIGGKRKGVVLELKEDLIDDIGRDAARFYFLLNSYETPATVDVELAKRQTNENPVFYVQYAHARLCNILRRAEEMQVAVPTAREASLNLLQHTREIDVLRKLTDYPGEITLAADRIAPHRLTRFAMDLAGLLNLFYENCRVLPSQEAPQPVELTQARLVLVNGARIVLANLLGLLGISAPERMERQENL